MNKRDYFNKFVAGLVNPRQASEWLVDMKDTLNVFPSTFLDKLCDTNGCMASS